MRRLAAGRDRHGSRMTPIEQHEADGPIVALCTVQEQPDTRCSMIIMLVLIIMVVVVVGPGCGDALEVHAHTNSDCLDDGLLDDPVPVEGLQRCRDGLSRWCVSGQD